MDETWLHYFTPKSNRQSSDWTAHDEPASKCGKTQQSAGKVMASGFWHAHEIIFIYYLEKGRTINRKYYIALLDRLKDEITEKRPHLRKKKCCFTKKHTVSQVSENNGKNPLIGIRIASSSTISSRSGTGFQISKECSLEIHFRRIKRLSPKLRSILKQRANCTTKMVSESWRVAIINVSSLK
ncbi:hypothetical protein GWI33_014735 [Rhynchophorus ferrugineus]|uniref:Transposase n=1 Tax=Rhynchophorus ferrugineus TaxID=354439 RepID=A0A834M8T3_RHYFE|nr:hypothetical protein GWI33_014735 [Rhynchophorus ferrugineus]